MNPAGPSFATFVKRLLVFTLLLALLAYILRTFLPDPWKCAALPFLILFFFSVNVLVHYILLKASRKKFSSFVNYYLGGTFLKLLLYIIVLVLYVWLHQAEALTFGITYLLLYLAFTVFEVISLLGLVQPPPSDQPSSRQP